jgi:hypothetical protein
LTSAPLTAEAQDYERMMSMVTGFWITQIVRSAAAGLRRVNLSSAGAFAVIEAQPAS